MRIFLVAVLVPALAAAGCGSTKRELSAASNTVNRPGAISCWADWLKDKGDKFDVGFSVRNDHFESIVIFLDEISGGRGDVEGQIRHAAAWGFGERAMDFRAGQTKSFTLTCNLPRKVETGAYRVVINRVHDNPNHDGHTPGKMIAENIVWTME